MCLVCTWQAVDAQCDMVDVKEQVYRLENKLREQVCSFSLLIALHACETWNSTAVCVCRLKFLFIYSK